MTSSIRTRRRGSVAIVATAALALVLSACSGGGETGGTDESEGGEEGEPVASAIDCSLYDEFGDLEGTTVKLYTTIVEPESDTQKASYVPFEECTGVTVEYEGSREFEAQLPVRIQAGTLPDIAFLPQPGLLRTIVTEYPDAIVPAPEAVVKQVEANFNGAWKEYGSVDGEFYAAPLGSNVKSFVWYSPSMFADAGYEVPETWDDMMALSEEIAVKAEAGESALPWCMGVESGDATGWHGTDFIEDVVLRTAGPEVYDQWATHEIPFNDPAIVDAFDKAGEIIKNDRYVNAGLGGVDSIATTPWGAGGLGILDGSCWMHRGANFWATQLPEGTDVSPEGDIWAFYLPGDGETSPVLVGGEFTAAFNDRPEVQAFQTYLASADWANQKAIATPEGGWISANQGLERDNLSQPFDLLSYDALNADPDAQRFDGSDLLPGHVGAGTFWTGIVDWLTGKDTKTVVDTIEASWPTS